MSSKQEMSRSHGRKQHRHNNQLFSMGDISNYYLKNEERRRRRDSFCVSWTAPASIPVSWWTKSLCLGRSLRRTPDVCSTVQAPLLLCRRRASWTRGSPLAASGADINSLPPYAALTCVFIAFLFSKARNICKCFYLLTTRLLIYLHRNISKAADKSTWSLLINERGTEGSEDTLRRLSADFRKSLFSFRNDEGDLIRCQSRDPLW